MDEQAHPDERNAICRLMMAPRSAASRKRLTSVKSQKNRGCWLVQRLCETAIAFADAGWAGGVRP